MSNRRDRRALVAAVLSVAVGATAFGLVFRDGPVLPGFDDGVPPAVTEKSPRLFEPSATREQRQRQRFVPGRVIVRFHSGVSERVKARVRHAAGVRLLRRLPLPGVELVSFAGTRSTQHVRQALAEHPQTAYAEPDVIYDISNLPVPNDPQYSSLWALNNSTNTDMDAPEAWSVATGSRAVTVGVVDSGVAWNHPDLAENIWANAGETGEGRESNGQDDDGNGYIDDFHGWDWVEKDNDPMDPHGHGTHVAGTIGAVGNNALGITGVNWGVGIVPLRVLDAAGSGTGSSIAAAFAYAGQMGIDVVNVSLGGPSYSQTVADAIKKSPDTLFVAAAGNEAADNDQVASYPCNYALANVLCVAAVTQSDTLASFSNYGAKTVHLGAPGENILSTLPTGTGYGRYSGTSMAAPHVSGAAGLLQAVRPNVTASEIRRGLLAGAVPVPALHARTTTGARVSVSGGLRALGVIIPEAVPTMAATPIRTPTPSPTSVAAAEQLEPTPPPAERQPDASSPNPPAPLPTRAEPAADPVSTPSATPPAASEQRIVTLALVRHLVAKVEVTNPSNLDACAPDAQIAIKRNGALVTEQPVPATGRLRVRLRDRPGRYTAVIPASTGCARAVDRAHHAHGEAAASSARGLGSTCWEPLPVERRLRRLHNAKRLEGTLGRLRLDGEMSKVARSHSVAMMERASLFHRADLGAGVTGWSALGENVGVASTVESVEEAFMGSAPHRQNILTRQFTRVGIGIVQDDDRVWVTVLFKAPSAPATQPRLPIC